MSTMARGLLLAAGVLLAGALFPPLQAQEKAPAAPQSTRAQQLMGDIAPKLAELTDNVLFGDVWERPGLAKRDRSLVTVSALIALNRPDQLRSHLTLARQNGVTQEEIGRGHFASRLLCWLAKRRKRGWHREGGLSEQMTLTTRGRNRSATLQARR